MRACWSFTPPKVVDVFKAVFKDTVTALITGFAVARCFSGNLGLLSEINHHKDLVLASCSWDRLPPFQL